MNSSISGSKMAEIENFFKNEQGNGCSGYEIKPGTSNIILTAPHSVSQQREGEKKSSEYRTGLIVIMLQELTGAHIAYKTENLSDDANYDLNCDFKSALSEYIAHNSIDLLMDFHISASSREFDFDIGTGRGKNIKYRRELVNKIVSGLENHNYERVYQDHIFRAEHPGTVSSTISSKNGIPSLQIEINWNCISSYQKTRELVYVFSQLIKDIEVIV